MKSDCQRKVRGKRGGDCGMLGCDNVDPLGGEDDVALGIAMGNVVGCALAFGIGTCVVAGGRGSVGELPVLSRGGSALAGISSVAPRSIQNAIASISRSVGCGAFAGGM